MPNIVFLTFTFGIHDYFCYLPATDGFIKIPNLLFSTPMNIIYISEQRNTELYGVVQFVS